MKAKTLFQMALKSGLFPNITAYRLSNVIEKGFAYRYLIDEAKPARNLKMLVERLNSTDFEQLLLIYTSRANLIFADFIREVYWQRYAVGYNEISNDDARRFVEQSVDEQKTTMRWSESQIKKASSNLTGCCADFRLLERGRKIARAITPVRISPRVAAYLAHDLHFAGLGDNAVRRHRDWHLFGLDEADVLDELKRLALKNLFVVQAAGDAIRISWKYQNFEEFLQDVSRF